VIRKLAETPKVKLKSLSRALKVWTYFKKKNEVVATERNWGNLNLVYDLSNGSQTQLSAKEFCDIFIHSLVFMPSFNDSGQLASVLITTDWKKKKYLYSISIDSLTVLLDGLAKELKSRKEALRRPKIR
jgi:hypothetical protein